jgi:hypothetical protein
MIANDSPHEPYREVVKKMSQCCTNCSEYETGSPAGNCTQEALSEGQRSQVRPQPEPG